MEDIEKVIKKAAVALDQGVVLATPVDTGRARNNWIVDVGSIPSGEPNEPNKQGTDALAQGENAIDGFQAGKGIQGSIFIMNNVPYIIPLTDGHSVQAPPGFIIEQGMMAAERVLKRAGKFLRP